MIPIAGGSGDKGHSGTPATVGWNTSTLRQSVILYFCAFAVRCLFIVTVHWELKNDTNHYYHLAQELLRGEYSSTIREPGYPAFVAILAVFGDHNLRSMYLIQALITSLLPVVSLHLYHQLLSSSRLLSFWLAFAIAVHPELASFSGLLLRESLFCLLMTWLAVLMILAIRRPTLVNYSWVGLLGGVCCLIRTETLSFISLFAGYAMLRASQCERRERRALVGLTCLVLVIGPWIYRNYRYHHFVGLTSAGSGALFVRTYYLDRKGEAEPEVRALAERTIREDRLTDEEVRQFLVPAGMIRRVKTDSGDYDEAHLMKSLGVIARENIRNHPAPYLVDSLKEFRSLFGGYSWYFAFPGWAELPGLGRSIEEHRWWLVAIKVLNGGGFPVVMWFLLAASLAYRPWSDDWKDSCFLLIAVMTFCVIVSSIGFVENRFRDNYEPILFGICARGWLAIAGRLRASTWKL